MSHSLTASSSADAARAAEASKEHSEAVGIPFPNSGTLMGSVEALAGSTSESVAADTLLFYLSETAVGHSHMADKDFWSKTDLILVFRYLNVSYKKSETLAGLYQRLAEYIKLPSTAASLVVPFDSHLAVLLQLVEPAEPSSPAPAAVKRQPKRASTKKPSVRDTGSLDDDMKQLDAFMTDPDYSEAEEPAQPVRRKRAEQKKAKKSTKKVEKRKPSPVPSSSSDSESSSSASSDSSSSGASQSPRHSDDSDSDSEDMISYNQPLKMDDKKFIRKQKKKGFYKEAKALWKNCHGRVSHSLGKESFPGTDGFETKKDLVEMGKLFDSHMRHGGRLTDPAIEYASIHIYQTIARVGLGAKVAKAFTKTGIPAFHLLDTSRILKAAKDVERATKLLSAAGLGTKQTNKWGKKAADDDSKTGGSAPTSKGFQPKKSSSTNSGSSEKKDKQQGGTDGQ